MTRHQAHKLSDYPKFELYHKVNKPEFKRDKIWTASRVIIEKKLRGYERLRFLLDKAKKAISSTADHDGTRYTRDEDMVYRVLAVLAAIGSKTPLSIFDNRFMKNYTSALNSKHRTPYPLERNRIVIVVIDYVMSEFTKILCERREELGDAFISATTDFWSDPHRKEQYGALAADLIAHMYMFADTGHWYFMSKETAERLGKKLVSCSVLHYYLCSNTHHTYYLVHLTFAG